MHPLGTNLGNEGVRPVGFLGVSKLHLGQQLVFLQWRVAGIDHEIILVVNDPLEVSRGDIHHQADTRRHTLKKPNVGHRHGQLDVPHALAPNTRLRHLDTAPVADNAAMLDALVLAAGAFPILDRTEDALAKKTALLRLECPVVDGLGVLDLTLGPRADGLRGRHRDGDVFHAVDLI